MGYGAAGATVKISILLLFEIAIFAISDAHVARTAFL
jgi:hypothetical protein